MLESFWDHFGIILESFGDDLGIILESFLDHFGNIEVILGSWDHFGVLLKPFSNFLGPCVRVVGAVLEPFSFVCLVNARFSFFDCSTFVFRFVDAALKSGHAECTLRDYPPPAP